MVACGVARVLVALWAAWRWLRGRRNNRWLDSKWFLRTLIAAAPLGFIAIEAGWIVTEVGRQPWIIYGIMRTKDAVTPMPGIVYSFYLFTAVYVSLALIVTFLLYRQIKMVPVIYDVPNNKPD